MITGKTTNCTENGGGLALGSNRESVVDNNKLFEFMQSDRMGCTVDAHVG